MGYCTELESTEHIKDLQNVLSEIACGVMTGEVCLGFFLVYIYFYRNITKPPFLNVVWTLSVLSICLAITSVSLVYYKHSLPDDRHGKKRTISNVNNFFYYLEQALIAIAHWVFAIKYFEAAIKLSQMHMFEGE